ncbi:hypothetical protein [Geobacter sp.]|uniref:hypothetical protein n=1 Tax=Geobacter sp. TaxID=46610 RepID=UPI0027BA1138|nr:hypothetical protein [Geobacter sp.]
MDFLEASKLAAEAEILLGQLLEEAVSLLRNFDTSTPEELEATIRRREAILERFHAIDGLVNRRLEDLSPQELVQLEDFKRSREELARKILETDSLIIALAQEQLSEIKGDLATLAKGKNALHAYEGSSVVRSGTLNDSA